MAESASPLPEVTDEDIAWVRDLLKLDEFDEPRREFLQSRSTVDVLGCPGSRKTTLIVAKLAIFARKWPYRTRGICVLSHTNVAREQIERRLGQTMVGQRLLSYPHFVDTIHSFANHFLALPWLYSNGYAVNVIDDEIAIRNRWFFLPQKYRYALEQSGHDREILKIIDVACNLGDLRWGRGVLGRGTCTYKALKLACEKSIQDGFHCYDEMFVWANALLEDHPELPDWFSHRFPLVILDEMQDTSIRQEKFLNKVFPRTSSDISVQRVGDPNQKIFEVPESGHNAAGSFPDDADNRHLEFQNSYRFGQNIADLASPFAVRAVGSSGLCGMGPSGDLALGRPCSPAIFVFPDNSTKGVLKAYAAYVLEVLGQELAKEGPVTAVGHVHKEALDVAPGDPHYPKTVGHYWSGYSANVSGRDPYPETLVQYVRVAQGLVADGRTLSPGCDKFASGVIELARRMGDVGGLKRKMRTHRAVVEALGENPHSLASYRALLRDFLVERKPLEKKHWEARNGCIAGIAAALCAGGADSTKGGSFLDWPEDDRLLVSAGADSPTDVEPNVFRFSNSDGTVNIRLGSIHSVKGQTHLATLLLSTYWYGHSATWMMPWLLGDKTNGANCSQRDLQRLFHTYVAMTRPSHLLCLAVPRSGLEGNGAIAANVKTLQERGWCVAEVIEGTTRWWD